MRSAAAVAAREGQTRGLVAGIDGWDASVETVAHDAASHVRDAINREAELLEDRASGRRSPEVIDADDRALVAGVALPTRR
jgi:hypothetical protein